MRYLVVDLNSGTGPDMDGSEDWSRFTHVDAESQAEACTKAKDAGFQGLLFAMTAAA